MPAPTDYDRGTDDCQSGSRKDDKLEIRTYSFDVREVHIPPSFRSLGSCDNHIMLDRETGGDIHSGYVELDENVAFEAMIRLEIANSIYS